MNLPHTYPLTEEAAATLLKGITFIDPSSAARALVRVTRGFSGGACRECLPHLLHALAVSADPSRVLASFERFVESYSSWDALSDLLSDQPRSVEILAQIFSGSQYLTDILLRRPEQVHLLLDYRRLSLKKTPEQYNREALAATAIAGGQASQLDILRRWQRGELLRIGAGDILGSLDLPALTLQLSNLAEGVVRAALSILVEPVGSAGFAVIAMGKLGGRELNYSSDIDLLFVSAADNPAMLRLGQQLINALAGITGEGFLYRVDMRLRPWGRTGALVPSLEAYLSYLQGPARLWEKQALLKARWIAGDQVVAEEFLQRASELIFEDDPETIRSEILGMKQRTESFLHQQRRDWGEVKLGEGSIRDVEFTVQYLQLVNGSRQPELRTGHTLEALRRLHTYGLLPTGDQRTLMEGYTFLRAIEHHLQLMHYRQTQTLPADSAAQDNLARRLGFRGERPADAFLAHYHEHIAAIRELYLKYMASAPEKDGADPNTSASPLNGPPDLARHVARMDPSYQATFSAHDLRRHATLAGQLDSDHLAFVDANPLDNNLWRLTVVAYDYPGELSLICGLMFSYGLDIMEGSVFTYEPLAGDAPPADARRKIVDVFIVRPSQDGSGEETWSRYCEDLIALLRLVQDRQPQEARSQLARRAASSLSQIQSGLAPLYPIKIEFDNELSTRYTVLRISSTDTIGFLYELTNSLALQKIYIARVEIETTRRRVSDTLYVTDDRGNKLTDPEKQRELTAAAVLIKHFTHLLPLSPDPESALLHFGELVAGLFARSNWPDELGSLERPDVLESLARLLGVSDFLWYDFLRMQYSNLFPVVKDVDALKTAKDRPQLERELQDVLRLSHPGPQLPSDRPLWRDALNAFKDREMFRIDMRHLLGHTQEFRDFSEELTALAEVIVNAAFHLCHEDLRLQYGSPRLEDGSISQMAVVALGKCGGRELGFASDIELMFVYAGNGRTDRQGSSITTAEFFEKLVENFLRVIRTRREGIFEIDLQLRPYGKAGSLSVSLESFRRYFAVDGPAWPYERQALVKLRAIAGDETLGQRLEALRDSIIYRGQPFDATAMRAMRERQLRHLVKGGTFNPKYSPGGLVDIEYLVQGLQMSHGQDHPALRTPNTYAAMAALADVGLLSAEDYPRLRKAYTFFRWLIDGLRVVAGNARDLVIPPYASEGFAYLARRLLFGDDIARLQAEIESRSADVTELNHRLLI